MCLNAGKLDGLCEEWQSLQPGGESNPDESRAAVSKAVDLYFDFYIEIRQSKEREVRNRRPCGRSTRSWVGRLARWTRRGDGDLWW